MAANGRVLIFGDDTRSFLACVRSLGRQGVEVHVAPFDFLAPALASRYIAAIHRLPPHLGDGADWLAALSVILRTQVFDLVIPCDERAALPLQKHRAALSPLTRLALPDQAAFACLNDKHLTRQLAASLDIPIAAGRLIGPDDSAELILAEAALPLMIKPRQSYRLEDLYSRQRVHRVGDVAGLTALLAAAQPEQLFFEAVFPGRGVGLSVLAHQGRILQAFEHHRVHERGGSGFYRVSAEIDQERLEAVRRMVAALDYSGVAMFEFRVDQDRWILLEVNARPWGSLPLPVGLGVDFPYRWYRLLVAGEETPPQSYHVGIHARNLLPDLSSLLAEAWELRARPLALAGLSLRSLAEAGRILSGREFHDVLVSDDPRPAWREISLAWRRLLQHLALSWPVGVALQRRADRTRWRRLLAAPPTLLFLCQGNICRSPFAAAALRRRIGGGAVTILSAGMLPKPGRAPPPAAKQAAAERLIDLDAHRSHYLSADLAQRADVIFLFDRKNLTWLRQLYPDLAAKVLFLGSFTAAGSPLEIADPDGGDPAMFRRTYDLIEQAVAKLQRDLEAAGLTGQGGGSGADAEASAATFAEKK